MTRRVIRVRADRADPGATIYVVAEPIVEKAIPEIYANARA